MTINIRLFDVEASILTELHKSKQASLHWISLLRLSLVVNINCTLLVALLVSILGKSEPYLH